VSDRGSGAFAFAGLAAAALGGLALLGRTREARASGYVVPPLPRVPSPPIVPSSEAVGPQPVAVPTGDGQAPAVIIDISPWNRQIDWKAHVAAGPPGLWSGVMFKVSQGTSFRYAWTGEQRKLFRAAAGDSMGGERFDGGTHYLDLHASGRLQADFFAKNWDLTGGDKLPGTLWCMLDVERDDQPKEDVTRDRVIHRVGEFALRYFEIYGRLPTLYGGEMLRALRVGSRMGCGRSAISLYGPRLAIGNQTTEEFLASMGTDLAHLFLWQYIGGERTPTAPGLPRDVPGSPGPVDISVVTLPGGKPELRRQLVTKEQPPVVGAIPAYARDGRVALPRAYASYREQRWARSRRGRRW